jgi:hypothetical protein
MKKPVTLIAINMRNATITIGGNGVNNNNNMGRLIIHSLTVIKE